MRSPRLNTSSPQSLRRPTVWESSRLRLWPIILPVSIVCSVFEGGSFASGVLLGFCLSALASFGFIWNDLRDARVDFENNEPRYVPESEPAKQIAVGMDIAFLVLGIAIAYFVSPRAGKAAALIGLGLFAYTAYLRRFLLVATVLATGLSTSPIWVPAIVWGNHDSALLGMAFWSAIYLMGREIVLDTKDRRGDGIGGRQTIPVIFGARAGLTAGFGLMVLGLAGFAWMSAGGFTTAPILRALSVLVSVGLLVPVIQDGTAALNEPHGTRMRRFVLSSRLFMLIVPVGIMVSLFVGGLR